jgi:hypothetical protein
MKFFGSLKYTLFSIDSLHAYGITGNILISLHNCLRLRNMMFIILKARSPVPMYTKSPPTTMAMKSKTSHRDLFVRENISSAVDCFGVSFGATSTESYG